MTGRDLFPLRSPLAAMDARFGAAAGKPAAGRGIDRTWDVPFEHHPLSGSLLDRIDDRDGREQRFRIRMTRVVIQLVASRHFDDGSKIHHRDPFTDILYHIQIVVTEILNAEDVELAHVCRCRIDGVNGDEMIAAR